MTKLLRCALTLAFGFSLSCCAQTPGTPTVGPGNTAGLLYASNFGLWQVPQGNTGQFSWSSPSFCTVQAAGIPLNPVFAVGSPIFIKDQVVANSEIVTPSAINVGGAGCSITVSPVNKHNTFTLTSATGGLQEAINYAHALPYQVILTPDWSRLGGTTGMILAAKGNSNVQILDQRGSCSTAYIWSGSAYAAQPSSCGGGSSGIISVNSQTGPSVTFQSSGATVAITNPSPNVINLESSGGGGGGCTPSGLAGDYLVDNGDGTCSPANANYTVGDFTTPNVTNFGESNGLSIDTASCDATTCTLLAANTLDARKDVPIYILSGFAASCLNGSGWVHVESIASTQIVIDEADTSCTGVVPSDTGGSIIYGYTDFIVNSAQHISLGGRYFSGDGFTPEPLSTLDGFFTKSTMDVTDPNVDASYSHINQEPTFLDLTTDQSEVKVSGSGYDSAPTGEVLLKTTSAVDGAVTSLDLLSDAESTLLVPRGMSITADDPNAVTINSSAICTNESGCLPPGWTVTGSGTSQVVTAPGTLAAETSILSGKTYTYDSAANNYLSPPAGFPWQNSPIKINADGSTNFDASVFAPHGKTYYVSVNGSDSNSGTFTAPFRTLMKCYSNTTDSVECHVISPGWYREDGVHSAYTSEFNHDINITADVPGVYWSRNICSPTYDQNCTTHPLVWTPQGGGAYYSAPYTFGIAAVVGCVDTSIADANGDFKLMLSEGSTSIVSSTANSWYYASNVLSVHTFDGRAPDTNIRCYENYVGTINVTTPYTVYLKNMNMVGGYSTIYINNQSAQRNLFVLDGGSVRNSVAGNGISSSNLDTLIAQNTIISGACGDAIAYSAAPITSPSLALEVNVTVGNTAVGSSTDSSLRPVYHRC